MTESHPTRSMLKASTAASLRLWCTTPWLRCLCLGLIGFVVRLPALQGEPIWDDDYLVRTNPLIKSPILILETFRHYLFQDTFSAAYRPVQNISYLFDYLFWNTNFYGFHLTSLLWHVTGGILLYLLLRQILPQVPSTENQTDATDSSITDLLAFFVALLWVVHPAHSAAVDYVSGRADSLAFVFACSAWLLFLSGRTASKPLPRLFLLAAAWIAGLLALCSRETGLVWLVIFFIWAVVFDRSAARPRWLSLVACAAIVAVYALLRGLPGPPCLPDETDVLPPAFRVVLMFRALGDYARVLLFPYNLHMERTVYDPKAFQSETGRWGLIEHEYLSIAGLLVLGVVAWLLIRRGRGQKLRILGAVWFFIAFLPVSNLINLNATVAEHWLYLPSVGLLIFLVGCALDLPVSFHRAAAAFACLAVTLLGVRSVYRSSDWVSNEVFARRTIASGGASLRIVLLLGQVYAARGDYAAAEHLLRRAVQLSPNYPMARNNLADALFHLGRQDEAEAMFGHSNQTAVEDRKGYPRTWIAALNLSQLRHKEHDDPGALNVLENARKTYPGTWELISAESELLRENNRLDEALGLIEKFARENWWHYRAWGAYGRLLAQKGEAEAGAAALRHASWLDVHETAALNLIALVRMRQNKLEDACRVQRRAVARQPDEPRQYLLLSDILDRMGRTDEAHAALAQVTRLRELAGTKTAQN